MRNVDRYIAEAIVSTQVASDAGKCKYEITLKNNFAMHEGYDAKVHFQVRALEMIRNSKRSNFNYYVVRAEDQNGCDSVIVYFDFKIDGKRYQVSFHNPYDRSYRLKKYIGSGRVTRWNNDRNTSRYGCIKLIEYYGLNAD